MESVRGPGILSLSLSLSPAKDVVGLRIHRLISAVVVLFIVLVIAAGYALWRYRDVWARRKNTTIGKAVVT